MKNKRRVIKFLLIFLLALVGILIFCFYNSVDNRITISDERAIKAIVLQDGRDKVTADDLTYERQIEVIQNVQKRILQIAPVNKGIPEGRTREPEDLFRYKLGLCYDRSRTIEKALRYLGFKTRHISVFSTRKTEGNKLKAILTPGLDSHAITEVETKKGWLVVDSNNPWISIDEENKPYSIEDIQEAYNSKNTPDWNGSYDKEVSFIYKEGYTYLYGLYSRHGRFYPPFNFIPDVNWKEFFYNF